MSPDEEEQAALTEGATAVLEAAFDSVRSGEDGPHLAANTLAALRGLLCP